MRPLSTPQKNKVITSNLSIKAHAEQIQGDSSDVGRISGGAKREIGLKKENRYIKGNINLVHGKKNKTVKLSQKKIMSIKTYFTMYIMLTSIYRIIRDYILFFFLFFSF